MKIAVVASAFGEARKTAKALQNRYKTVGVKDADVIVVLGGDGFMLQTIHTYMTSEKPIFGMNCGTVGFLMNENREDDLVERIGRADSFTLHPLRMKASTTTGDTIEHLAVNEVSLLRETRQTAKIRVAIDGKVRLPELVGDGVMVATPAGSTAYNLSAHGPIIPLGANLLALTPLAAFRPRRWRGALLPHTVTVELSMLEAEKRPVLAVADMYEIRDVSRVTVEEASDHKFTLLFDSDHNLEERIFTEQFAY
ncbi:NAD kinase [Eilatimonas milleporae]|uniref:NAD kinase n=1 Tax=Eilatimonas milleporae TaxID=911205 RepID=A0A3M0C951_9PROT|nr:NAD kinase [Eilatimonas milleporae]RMB04890.1 NAD+ kinase [Eilatimonas milleporae]